MEKPDTKKIWSELKMAERMVEHSTEKAVQNEDDRYMFRLHSNEALYWESRKKQLLSEYAKAKKEEQQRKPEEETE